MTHKDDWFTVEEIDQDTFAISEYKHWERTHCYLLCGTEKALLIDTGLGIQNIKKVVDQLTNLPVQVVTTHVHWDHIGGHQYFDQIAVFEGEEKWLSGHFPLPLTEVKRNLLHIPFEFPTGFQLDDYHVYQGGAKTIFKDGAQFDLGNRKIEAIHTPGHSPGHCCFYEKERQYLFTGDLIYQGQLDMFYPTTDPQLFWQSVQKIQQLPLKKLLPGHHELFISLEIVDQIEAGFRQLEQEGKLAQGNGVFAFENYQIRL